MIRLEVQKIDSKHLRINLESAIFASRAVQSYRSILLSDISPLIQELTESIPNQFLRTGTDEDLLEKLKNKAQTLYQVMFGDLVEILSSGQNPDSPEQLIVYLDEELAWFPIDLLYDGTRFLWESFIISRQISTTNSIQVNSQNHGTKNELAIVGNPLEDEKLEFSIRDECLSISEDMQDSLPVSGPYFGRDVSNQQLIELLSTHHFFHFSGHFQNESQTESGWQLFDNNNFSQREILQLSKVPKFIFNNSCGSTASIGQGGFIRIFLDQGVQTYLATNMDIPTLPATFFAINFYQALAKTNSPGKALFQSRKSLVEEYGWKDLTWMAYVLYGNADFQALPESKWRKSFRIISTVLSIGLLAAAIYLIQGTMKDRFFSHSFYINTNPANSVIFLDDHMQGQTPHFLSIRNKQLLSVKHNGYRTRNFQFIRIKNGWEMSELDEIAGIVSDQVKIQVQNAQTDSLKLDMIPEQLHIISFADLGNDEAEVMIQGTNLIFQGEYISLAVDSSKHRFIVRTSHGVYDRDLEISSDTTFSFIEPGPEWNKDRFH